MSHADDEYDHAIEHHDPQEGFDRSEPKLAAISAVRDRQRDRAGADDRGAAVLFRADLERSGVREGAVARPASSCSDLRNRETGI